MICDECNCYKNCQQDPYLERNNAQKTHRGMTKEAQINNNKSIVLNSLELLKFLFHNTKYYFYLSKGYSNKKI